MRIIFATGQGGGHFQPLVPFARAAAHAGHDVVVAAPASARGMVERAGFAFYALGEPWDRAERWAPVFGPDGPGAEHVIQELFIGLDAYAALPGMLALVHNHEPDLIVRETPEFSSPTAAAHFKVPVVAVGPHLDAAIDTDGGLHAIAAPALERLGPYRLHAPGITPPPFGGAPGGPPFRHAGAGTARPVPPRRAGDHAPPVRRRARRAPLPPLGGSAGRPLAGLRVVR